MLFLIDKLQDVIFAEIIYLLKDRQLDNNEHSQPHSHQSQYNQKLVLFEIMFAHYQITNEYGYYLYPIKSYIHKF